MATTTTTLPTWHDPSEKIANNDACTLKVYNSLTRTKTPFVPMSGKRVLWYMCGPTVYDQTHLGHGRTYTCFDYIRRILSSYFSYDIELVMNITDIDDKIIVRAAEQAYAAAGPKVPSLQGLSKADVQKTVLKWASANCTPEANMTRTQELSSFWEESFMADMKSLGILPPTAVTRVSEYVPEIIKYVQQIISNGYAYAVNGSVYFDTAAFTTKRDYGKLVPENVGQSGMELLAEGEGSITTAASVGAGDKKSPSDFCLWKVSKEGEPFWDSPWGAGRPGWHIECSAMASDVLESFAGGKIDIHTGGIDLRFPHHDNEIAQCEAHYTDIDQWINYFIHTGHLNIEGLKMSKSLKNFVKIKEALENHSARQLRFLFLLHKYNVPMDYNDHTMTHAVGIERYFHEFFQNIKVVLREAKTTKVNQKWEEVEKKLEQVIVSSKARVHAALCDDFNTPLAITILQELSKEVYRYIENSTTMIVPLLVSNAAEYITSIFSCFGLVETSVRLGFPASSSNDDSTSEKTLAPILDCFTSFRDSVRTAARSGDVSSLLSLCDSVRDVDLVECGVRLEDKANKSVWKLEDVSVLKEERERKVREAAEKAAAKKEMARVKAAKEEALRLQAEIVPTEMFKGMTLKYSKFDEDTGLPTHNAEGEELSKGAIKKLKKEQEKQVKLYAKYH